MKGAAEHGPGERSKKEKMLAGELYRAVGPELAADRLRADRLLRAYNAAGADEAGRRAAILRELLGSMGEGVVLRPPFHRDLGYNIRLGRDVFEDHDVASRSRGSLAERRAAG